MDKYKVYKTYEDGLIVYEEIEEEDQESVGSVFVGGLCLAFGGWMLAILLNVFV